MNIEGGRGQHDAGNAGGGSGEWSWQFVKEIPDTDPPTMEAIVEAQGQECVRWRDLDLGQAVGWYEKAASQGHIKAAYKLGLAYYEGSGVGKNARQARKWFSVAADENYAPAQYYLGKIYADGNGVRKSYSKALAWFTKAVDGGFDQARGEMIDVTERMQMQAAGSKPAQPGAEKTAAAKPKPAAAVASKQPAPAVASKQPAPAIAKPEPAVAVASTEPTSAVPRPKLAAAITSKKTTAAATSEADVTADTRDASGI